MNNECTILHIYRNAFRMKVDEEFDVIVVVYLLVAMTVRT